MVEVWLIVLSLALLGSIALNVAIGFALWKRHRYLFQTTRKLHERIDDTVTRLRVEMRQQDVLAQPGPSSEQGLPRRFTSQFGEDIILYDFFRARPPGYFIEAGAFDGVTISNSYLLESLGWRGLLVEANPTYAMKCKANRPGSKVVHAAIGPANATGEVEFTCVDEQGAALSYLVGSEAHVARCEELGAKSQTVRVPYTSLDRLLEGEIEKVDFISLDLEGVELEALRGINLERYRPDVLVIEHEYPLAGSEIAAYLRPKGYSAEARRAGNVFFVHERLRDGFRQILAPEDRLAS